MLSLPQGAGLEASLGNTLIKENSCSGAVSYFYINAKQSEQNSNRTAKIGFVSID
ncbi:MAG: hypothetical protein JKX67_03685 [Colwellia sp.]|nr:hypothetical protein [Colwellia sp.]